MFWAYEAGGRFVYTDGDQDREIPVAVDVDHELLRQVLDNEFAFAEWAELPPMPLPVLWELRDRWCVHQGLPTDPAEMNYLLAMLEEYGSELEADFRRLGIDLVTQFRARRWRLLYNAFSRMPYATHYRQTMLNDPETAEALMAEHAKQGDDQATKNGVPVSEFTQIVSLVSNIGTVLRGNTAAVIAGAGGKPGMVEPFPGPITELKAAESRNRQRDHRALVARVLPGKRESAGL